MDIGLLIQTGLFREILDYFLSIFGTCAKWDNIRLTHL